jgi:hypothetical protein
MSIGANTRFLSSVDEPGVNWHPAISNQGSGISLASFMWYGGVGRGASATITITTTGAGAQNAQHNVSEWTNMAPFPLDDGGAAIQGNSTTPTTNTYSTVAANELIMACLNQASMTAGPTTFPAGYMQLTGLLGTNSGTPSSLFPSFLVPAPAGPQTASWTLPTALPWITMIQGFKDTE